MKPHPVVNYTDFYNTQLPEDKFTLLKVYPTDLILLRLTKINSILFNEPDQNSETQQEIFRQCFPLLSKDKRERVVAELMNKKHGGEIAFFTAPSILRLINLCFRNYHSLPPQEELFNTQQFEDDLFDSVLIQNDLYYTSLSVENDLQNLDAIWQLQLMQQAYVRSHSDLLMIAPIKSFLFYKFLMKHFPNGAVYIKEFCEKLGIDAYFNYYMFFMDILQKVFNSYKGKEAKHILTLAPGQEKLVQHFSFKPEDFEQGKYEGNIHKELMPKPFYFIRNESPVIIDFHFFEHVVDLALAFNFYNLSSLKNSKKFPNFPQFKSELGKSYYEGFVLKEIFRKIYDAKNYSVFHASDNSPLSDFTIVRNQRGVLLIEVKSAEIHFNPLEKLDIEGFKTFLSKNFCSKKEGVETTNRGVFQLVNQIDQLANTDKLDQIIKNPSQKRKLTIYPVIVYLENTLDMAGVNSYLNEDFEVAVESAQNSFRKILPLTTINLSFILRYYSKLKKEPAILFDAIGLYHRVISEKKKEYTKSPHPMSFFEKNISFDQYANKKLPKDDISLNFRAIVKDLELIEE